MYEAQITFAGNVATEPRLNFLQSGAAVANLLVMVNGRVKKGDQWEEGPTVAYDVACWGNLGENVAESIGKGDRVTVTGRLTDLRHFQTQNGEDRVSASVTADEVGPSLRFATARSQKAERPQGQGQQPAQQPQGGWQGQGAPQGAPGPQGGAQQAPQQDPWATQGPPQQQGPPQGGWQQPQGQQPYDPTRPPF